MIKKLGMVYLNLILYLISSITYIFNKEQIDADLRFQNRSFITSISMLLFVLTNILLGAQIVTSIISTCKTHFIIIETVLLIISFGLTSALTGLGKEYVYYPLFSVGTLIAPFVIFIGFIGVALDKKISKINRLIANIIFMSLFIGFAVFFFAQGNTIFFDTFSFGVRKSNGLFIAHRSGPENGPEGTAYTIERTCQKSHPYAIELDIRLTQDGQLVLSHDSQIDHYTDEAKFRGQNMIDQPLSVLTQINIGRRWVRVDPYGKYQKGVPEQVLDLTLNSAEEGVNAIQQYCTMQNGSGSMVMLDVKDKDNIPEVFQAMKNLVDKYPGENFTIRMVSSKQYKKAAEVLGDYDNVVFQSTIGMKKESQFISAVAFEVPEYRRRNPSSKVISWTIQNRFYARILGGTGSIITTDYVNINTDFHVIGGGYLIMVYVVILLIMMILTSTQWTYQQKSQQQIYQHIDLYRSIDSSYNTMIEN